MIKKAVVAATVIAGAGAMLSPLTASADNGVQASATTQGMFERSGWYVGIDLGGAFNPGATAWNCNNCQNGVNKVNTLLNEKGNSGTVTGGVYGGYQYRWEAPVVTGFELDFNGLGDIRKNNSNRYSRSWCSDPGGRLHVDHRS